MYFKKKLINLVPMIFILNTNVFSFLRRKNMSDLEGTPE